jgi:hypothetical protein
LDVRITQNLTLRKSRLVGLYSFHAVVDSNPQGQDAFHGQRESTGLIGGLTAPKPPAQCMPSAFGSIRCVKKFPSRPYSSPGFAPDMVNRITPSVGPAVPLRVELAILRRARGPDVQSRLPPRPPGSGQVMACLAANEASAFAALPTKAAVGGAGAFQPVIRTAAVHRYERTCAAAVRLSCHETQLKPFLPATKPYFPQPV